MRKIVIIGAALAALSFNSFAAPSGSAYDRVQDGRISNIEGATYSNHQELVDHRVKIDELVQVAGNHEGRITDLENRPLPKDGKDGKDGAQGIQGEKGEIGLTGAKGDKGDVGLTGATGSGGVDGRDGKDADMTAVNNQINSAIQSQNKQFSDLRSKIDDNEKKANAGSASAMAAAGVPQVLSNQTFALGAAIGGYESEQAVAVGASYRASENVTIKTTVAADTQQGFGYNAGVSVGW